MALLRTLGVLVTKAKQHCDMENDGLLAAAEWRARVSEKYGELHACLMSARFFDTEATITATGASSYALPADHLQTMGVDFVFDSAGSRNELLEATIDERTIWAGQTGEAVAYVLTGTTIVLYPTPSSGTYKHIYVAQPTDYSSSADSTSIDVINTWGEKFIMWGAASVAQHKSESSQQRAIGEAGKAWDELQYISAQRTMNNRRRSNSHAYIMEQGDFRPRFR